VKNLNSNLDKKTIKYFILAVILLISLIKFNPQIFSHDIKVESMLEISDNGFTPKGIRITAEEPPNQSVVISWYTESETSEPKVIYSKDSLLADNLTETATVNNVDGTYIYNAYLPNLEANTTYFYQVYSNASIFRDNLNFTTAPNRTTNNLKFLLFGDSRTQREQRSELVKKVMENFSDIDFFIHTGDIVEDGTIQSQWDAYFDDIELLSQKILGYFIEGNHERLNGNMYENIPLPSNGINSFYYSFNIGPVNFIGLNTERDRTVQTSWLEAELQKAEQDNDTLWKCVYMHQPIFNSRSNRDDLTDLISDWCPLFEQYNVDLIFAGHNHYYERSYPMDHLKAFDDSSSYVFENPSNPMYIITGGAGAPLYVRDTDPGYAPFYNSSYHFIIIDINLDDINEKAILSFETWAMPEDYSNIYLIDNMTIIKRGASVNIHNPLDSYLYGQNSPEFNVSIEEFKLKPNWFTLNSTWYEINNLSANYPFYTSTGKINQDGWDLIGNGTIGITFFANDSLGNVYSSGVILRKDIIAPNLMLDYPQSNLEFGDIAPDFIIYIDEINLDKTWYTINISLTQYFFYENSSIDQNLWNNLPYGIYRIRFYANDTVNNTSFIDVLIEKKENITDSEPESYFIFTIIYYSVFSLGIILAVFKINRKIR